MSKFFSNFSPAIDAMLEYRAALGFKASSLGNSLGCFDRYCLEHHPGCSELTKELAFEWLGYRAENPKGNVSGDAGAIRQFAEYLTATGRDAYVLPQGFYPRKPAFSPYIFTDAELSALFNAIDTLPRKRKSNEAAVAPVLFRLIYSCGLRPNEGRVLMRENVNFDTGEIYVTNTKKKKDRVVVMPAAMLSLCKEYSKHCRLDGCFFPRTDGQPYTNAQVDRLFKKCWSNANPGETALPNVRTYDLRHRFASARLNRWLDEGADLNNKLPYLRAYMGHKELSETAYYIHILPENLVKSAGVNWAALNSILPEVTAWEK